MERHDYCANCAADLDKVNTPKSVMNELLMQITEYIDNVEKEIVKAKEALEEARVKRACMHTILDALEKRPAFFDGNGCY